MYTYLSNWHENSNGYDWMLLRDLLSVSYCICPVMTLSSVHTLSLYGQSKLWFWVSAMNIVLVRWHYTVYAKSVYEKCSVVSLNWFYGQESSYSTNIMGVTVLRINVIEKHLQIKVVLLYDCNLTLTLVEAIEKRKCLVSKWYRPSLFWIN